MHTLTWLIWLATGLVAVGLAPHPLYLGLVFLAAALVVARQRSDAPLARSYGLFLRAGGLVCAGYLLFSVVTVGGARGATVLLRLPELRLPPWLGGIAFGGPITAEALAWGATRGMAIWTLLALFGAFNALVDHYRLLRLTPRSLFHAGLVVTIAVGFVPGLVRSMGAIIEAQRARGHRFGGLRSWLPLVAPLLAGSLEQSMQLAESLDARGFGRTTASAQALGRRQMAVVGGLLAFGAGLFIWLYYGAGPLRPLALLLLLIGLLALGLALRALGRLVRRSSYRRERWRMADSLVALACLSCALAMLALQLGGAALLYNPFPRFSWPGFDLRVGWALLLLNAPALAGPRLPARAPQRQRHRRRGPDDEPLPGLAAEGPPIRPKKLSIPS
jgi:energy-coupling factor transport system permease protein